MGIISWLKEKREEANRARQLRAVRIENTRRSLAINDDASLIAQYAPELLEMRGVEGMAYSLQQVQEWNKICTPEQSAIFASRLAGSHRSWEEEGLTMPYWANLAVLRRLQNELGLLPPHLSEDDLGEFARLKN